MKPGQQLDDDAGGEPDGELAPVVLGADDQPPGRVALDVVHDQVVLGVTDPDLDDGHHVRVVKAGRQARFIEEHGNELGLAREVGVQPLDREEALEVRHAEDAREIHRSHAALGQLGHQLIAIVEQLSLPRQCQNLGHRRKNPK